MVGGWMGPLEWFKWYPGIPKTPVFGVVHGKTPDFGVVRERPQKCNLRFFNKIWYTSYVMKTWRFIIQERACFCHGSWFYMHLSWKHMRLSLLTPLQSGGGVYFTVFSRFFHALLGSLLILLGSLLILLGSSSRKPHGNFTVVFLHPHQLKGSENSRFLLSENGRSHWIYGANLENNMLTSSSALRGLCSEKLLFFATEHVFSTHEPWIFMLYVIKKLS